MRKLALIGVWALVSALAFAQNAPAPTNFDVYGSTFFDYQQSGTEWEQSTPIISNFTFSKLRFGFRAQINDNVKSTLEIDPRNGEFRHAYIDWAAMPGLTVTAGKTFTDFQQIVAIYGGGRMLLLGAKYQIPGLGYVNLQLGNKSDISFISGNYIIFPGTSTTTPKGSSTPAQTELLTYKQDPNIYFMPAIVAKPDLGDLSLEAGAEAQINPQYIGGQKVSSLGLDGYFTLGMMGFTFTNEFTAQGLNMTNVNQELTYYAQLTYTTGSIAPTVYFVTDVMKDFSNDPNTAIGIEFPITIAKNFKINPLFSYAIANYDAFEGNNAISQHLYDKNDWTLGVRFDYSFSQKF